MTGSSHGRGPRRAAGAPLPIFLVWLAVAAACAPASAAEAPHFATTRFLESDRCATAWVLSRFLHPGATFSFHERGELPADARLYDLPESDLRRDARRATVEVLIEREGLRDPVVLELARLVHEVEINFWATRRVPGSRDFERVLGEAFRSADSPEQALARCFDLLDGFREAGGRVDLWLAAPAPAESGGAEPDRLPR